VIHLAAGGYGSFGGGSKASVVTLTAQSGATATISPNLGAGVNNLRFDGLTIAGAYTNGARNVAFVNSRFTGLVRVDTPANVSNANILFDRDTFDGLSATASTYEGRLTVRGYDNGSPVGVKITNSHFGNGGCSDGVQIIGGAYGVQVGPGNEFSGIRQGSCSAHSDPIQFYGAYASVVEGNYFHDNSTAIMTPDGNGNATTVRDNVFVMDEYPWAYVGGSDVGSKLTHNVVIGGSLRIYAGNQNKASRDSVLRDNVSVIDATGTNITADHNLQPSQVTFTGGSGRNGYLLANSSAGKGAASDGLDVGILNGSPGTPPPPPPDTTAPETTLSSSGPTGTTSDNTPTFAFTASEANSVFECRVDSGSWADCTSPWTTSALSEGSHSVSVRATDVAGNTDASPATRSFTVDTAPAPDTTAPDTTISSGPTGTTNDSTPTFAFTSSEANSAFECRVDSGAWANCASPWTTSALGDGAHSASVRATDVAGNTDASPATRSFTVDTTPAPDTTPPDTTIASGPSGTTSSTSASFAFTSSESGSTFECKLDTGAWAACTSPKAYSPLSAASHTFSVRATDAAGNVDASPSTRTWTIQSAPVDHQPAAAYAYSPASPTAGQAVSFDASSATCDDAPCTYTWEDDGTDGPAGGQWPLGTGKTMAFTFQDPGVKNVRVTVADADGDTNSTMKAVTVGSAAPAPDTTPPDTSVTSGPTGTTSDNTPTFAFTATEAGSTFECKVDSGAWATCTSPWTTSALAGGPHGVSVRAKDAAGNTDASPATRSFTVGTAPPTDTTAPDTTIGSGPNAATNDSTPTFAFTASESGSTFQCRVDSGSWATCTSPWTTTALADGAHSASVRAKDAAGNTDASPAARSFTVDTQPPSTTIGSAPPTLSPGSSATVAFSSPDSGATFACRLDGGAWAACTSPKTYTGLTLGGHTVDVRATDTAGNVDSSPATASWTSIALPGPPASTPGGNGGSHSANHAPAVALVAPSAGATFTSTLNMAATASDDQGVRRVEFWVDGTRVARDTAAPYAASFAAGKSMSYGVHTVAVRAFDAAGSARSAAVTVTRVRASAAAPRTSRRSATGRARAASSSDDRQNLLVGVSMWRIGTMPADDAGTLLRGRGMPGRSAAVSLSRCGDATGAIAAVMQLNAGADGTLYARQAADGLCILRVKPFGSG
jgi:Big-like domain-containing protein/PKD domain-containing protein